MDDKKFTCRGCMKEALNIPSTLLFRIRTNEQVAYHFECALRYAVQSALDEEYNDPYYD